MVKNTKAEVCVEGEIEQFRAELDTYYQKIAETNNEQAKEILADGIEEFNKDIIFINKKMENSEEFSHAENTEEASKIPSYLRYVGKPKTQTKQRGDDIMEAFAKLEGAVVDLGCHSKKKDKTEGSHIVTEVVKDITNDIENLTDKVLNRSVKKR